jgi:hypothetical protein
MRRRSISLSGTEPLIYGKKLVIKINSDFFRPNVDLARELLHNKGGKQDARKGSVPKYLFERGAFPHDGENQSIL